MKAPRKGGLPLLARLDLVLPTSLGRGYKKAKAQGKKADAKRDGKASSES